MYKFLTIKNLVLSLLFLSLHCQINKTGRYSKDSGRYTPTWTNIHLLKLLNYLVVYISLHTFVANMNHVKNLREFLTNKIWKYQKLFVLLPLRCL